MGDRKEVVAGDTVTVVDLGNYKSDCQEPVPFMATVKGITDYPEHVVVSRATGKEYYIYYYQIKELLTKEEMEESYPEIIGLIPHGINVEPYGIQATYSKNIESAMASGVAAKITKEFIDNLISYMKQRSDHVVAIQVSEEVFNGTDKEMFDYAKEKGFNIIKNFKP